VKFASLGNRIHVPGGPMNPFGLGGSMKKAGYVHPKVNQKSEEVIETSYMKQYKKTEFEVEEFLHEKKNPYEP
jgi:hypothetical protein